MKNMSRELENVTDGRDKDLDEGYLRYKVLSVSTKSPKRNHYEWIYNAESNDKVILERFGLSRMKSL